MNNTNISLEEYLKALEIVLKYHQTVEEDSKRCTDRVNLETEIKELDLSERVQNVFKHLEIKRLKDLLNFTISDLASMKNLGRRSISDIQVLLKKAGYTLSKK